MTWGVGSMRKWISLLMIVILVGLAHLRRPLLPVHQERLYAYATGQQTLPGEVRSLPAWERLVLRDWFVVTLTEDRASRRFVSFGFGQYIKVLDTTWVQQALQLPHPAGR